MAVSDGERDYQVDPGELRVAGGNVADAVGPADGVDLVTSGENAYGVGDVHAGLARFCATWTIAIGALSARADSAAAALVAAADTYDAQEAEAARSVTSVAGG
ncbi:hypothetical protein BLA60_29585 [Actinophytocola xinjiangensis]|uniref:Excreted virulence factor EspC (Type VII ESX diderm) n=1 Tax=Actinophytocola xinjiangensis TaxID=485602 RepID=A0A7Z0WHR4_9PSEU|nr:hypothetical protein BLA60_29585 [Actinophytocola xinjiangensis]